MYCVVVKRGDFETYDLLYKTFGSRLPVIWDRRKHSTADAQNQDDRRADPPASWAALGFVVIAGYRT